MTEIVKLEKETYLKILDLIQAVNIHRRERLHAAKLTAWNLAKDLERHDCELEDSELFKQLLAALERVVKYHVRKGYLAIDEHTLHTIDKAVGPETVARWCNEELQALAAAKYE